MTLTRATTTTTTATVGTASQVSLVDLLDRLLGTGVVLAGDVVISLAGVDLVEVRVNALLTTARADLARPARRAPHDR